MEEKREYIGKLAEFLHENESSMSFDELADHLNRNGFETEDGKEYQGGRGTSHLVSTTYDWAECEEDVDEEAIARAFVDKKGEHPYEKDEE